MSRGKKSLKIFLSLAGAGGAAALACSACCLPVIGVLAAGLGLSSAGAAISGWYITAAGLVILALVAVGFQLRRGTKPQSANQCATSCRTAMDEERKS
jgi:K+ transporter